MLERSKIELTNEDNMELMARYPDNYFDLAIVDPPYGINESKFKDRTRKRHKKITLHKDKEWDNQRPKKEYFKQLKRVSKNQIVWGANYFTEFLPPSMAWIVWEKKIGGDFSDCELAYTSFERALKMFTQWSGGKNKIHPTQKPVKLYEWLLSNYAKEGDKILDTHAGSASIALACWNLKFDLVCCELDSDYYNAAVKRLENHKNQLQIF